MRRNRQSRRARPANRAAESETRKGWLKIGLVGLAGVVVLGGYLMVSRGHRALDPETLCPAEPASVVLLLVDVTDPMTVAQRQDFQNQLAVLRNSIPRYGKLVVMKVDSAADRLLEPVIVRCNPGRAEDVSEWTGNPGRVQRMHAEEFVLPLNEAFTDLSRASGSTRSPILESVQSAALTELLAPEVQGLPRRLILASDLLQNTDTVSFYRGLPSAEAFVESAAFRRVRTDLRDVEAEIWMLERSDTTRTQPRALVDLWDALLTAQGATVTRAYNVSG
ncbi:hypothetical protein Q0812_11845 [Brevundimonas sp. 2R-24]|uniref:Uncharacterized protein n=1 Tax=Peiella sedimenti TaxID=3061083 RepID=A0ABT8SQ32_9CAUL|nr:hypothetical protein [Caulobacteraceae bacterium XZ-24]